MRADNGQRIASSMFVALFTVYCSLFTHVEAWAQTAAVGSPVGTTTDQRISLDLKGVDILDVLKLLSQKSGLNFVAGRNVTGRVTIFAKDVDVWEAFERIVSANDLAYERRGALVNIMTARDYELLYGQKFQERKESRVYSLKFAKAAQLATALNQLKSTLGRVVVDEASNTIILNDVPERLEEMQRLVVQLDRQTETRIYSLNYADVEKLKEKLQDFLTPGVGTFNVDARTSKVVVTDLKEAMPKIERVILALDEQEGEVLIEAKIIKVELTDDQSLGIDWQRVFGGLDTKVRSNFRVLSDVIGGTATGAALKLLAGPENENQVIIEALKKYGTVETISNPRITVSNKQEAKILVGTKEAFVTVTTTVPATGAVVSSPEIQFVDVGTKLFVTPDIKRDGNIQLKIRPEVSSAKIEIFGSNRIPIVSTTEAETNVLVKSGSTLVIGGLIENKAENTRSQVPGLGDLPVVGAAFGSRVKTSKKTELVVFLTPQILTSTGEEVRTFASAPSIEAIVELQEPERALVPASYQALIRQRLSEKLEELLRSGSLESGSLVVSFVLDKNGRILGTPDVTSPNGMLFVQAGKAALEGASPFPPFPAGSKAERVQFRVTVDYHPTRPRPEDALLGVREP